MLFHIIEKKKRSRPMSPKAQMEQEKRMRREIANSNERRRMQCINAGFQNLRALMPQLSGEKLSKAAILQHTTEYIAKLEQEQKRAQSQNEQLKRMLMEYGRPHDLDLPEESPPPKRKKRDTECSDEGIGMLEPASESPKEQNMQSYEDLVRELADVRQQLDRERDLRQRIEERNHALESQRLHLPSPSPPITHVAHLSSSPMHHPMINSPINLKMESPAHSTSVHEVHYDGRSSLPPVMPAIRYNKPLETLCQAITHIENSRFYQSEDRDQLQAVPQAPLQLLNGEDSEKDSEFDDCKSESSGRDSPMGLCAQRLTSLSHTQHSEHVGLCQKYPITSNVLSRHPPYCPFPTYRPAVIVPKS